MQTTTKEILKVCIIQADLIWEDPQKNLTRFSEKFSSIQETVDLILLPEMFTTGFSNQSQKLGEDMNGPSVSWLREKAKEKNCVICGSLIIRENNCFYNRLVWMRSDGTFEYYDKRHLFRMVGEHQYYSAGKKKLIVELNGWRICPMTCYDLRFPVWSRNREKYDILIYLANWPEKRRLPWISLLPARATENQVYVIGVNRCGTDGNNILYSGDSAVLHPNCYTLSTTTEFEETIRIVELSYSELQKLRIEFPAALDADEFQLKDDN